jgi:[protein-PII] uridylyltransferase
MARSSGPLLVAPDLRGRAYAQAHSDATDVWFREVFRQALGEPSGLALVAVGGYGRRELSPFSDIDVILIHDDLDHYADAAEALWYPVWDRGIKMGYAVVTDAQARGLARTELNWATAFLAARLLAGDPAQFARLEQLTAEVWVDHSDDLLGRLADSVQSRHEEYGEVAFHIEPNLKEGRGGLRDIHALGWASQVIPRFADEVLDDLVTEAETLLDARVELHRLAGRAGDMLSLDAQEDVARALGDRSGHDLMELGASHGPSRAGPAHGRAHRYGVRAGQGAHRADRSGRCGDRPHRVAPSGRHRSPNQAHHRSSQPGSHP